ncbi:MAG: D-alanyl-D-alanine carboxypeptidase family protein [Pseudomonadota bacterium]
MPREQSPLAWLTIKIIQPLPSSGQTGYEYWRVNQIDRALQSPYNEIQSAVPSARLACLLPLRPIASLRALALFVLAACTVIAGASSSLAQVSGLGPYTGPSITVDVNSGNVLSSNRPFDAWYPASTTKMMTAYVVFRAVQEGRVTMQSPVRISQNAANQPPSKAGLAVGQTLTVETALRVLMVKSANDIAVALAESVAGSEPAFIAEMNRYAQTLGMRRTTFTNPHGLPSRGQVTTAYDLAVLTLALLRDFPNRKDFYSMPAVTLGRANWVNSNILLQRYRGAFGFKTGYICDSGFNLVAGARRGGRTLITVTLGARSGLERAVVTANNLDEGFRRAGGLFGSSGRALADLRPSGQVRTDATRMRPIVCQRPRVRPTFEELASAYGTASPAYAPQSASGNAFASSDASAVVLPGQVTDAAEGQPEEEINVLDVLLGPVIREPRPIALALGGATGPGVARRGRWVVPSPVARPAVGLAAAQPPAAVQAAPGQVAPSAQGPVVILQPPVAASATPQTTGTNIGRAIPRAVPAPIPRPY